MDKLQALHRFWSGFGWKAYDETSVPDEAVLPYVTYEAAVSEFDREIAVTASLWFRSTGWTEITAKEKEIGETISRGGRIVPYDGGAFLIRKGQPWAQRMGSSGDDDVRRIVLNCEIEYLD